MFSENLFEDMPSADTTKMRPVGISFEEFNSRFKTEEVKNLMAKYGIQYGANSSAGVTLAMPCNSDADRMKFHEFLNELDRKTDVYMRLTWAGNCGVFADKNVYEHTGVSTVGYIKKEECMYDFEDFYELRYYVRKFADDQKIVYRNFNHYEWKIKKSEKSTDLVLDDMMGEILKYANEVAGMNNAVVEVRNGKTGVDGSSPSYDAFVVYRKGRTDAFGQLGHFTIGQNRFGDCSISANAMLGGSYSVGMDLGNYKKSIEYVVNDISR